MISLKNEYGQTIMELYFFLDKKEILILCSVKMQIFLNDLEDVVMSAKNGYLSYAFISVR